MNASSLCSLEMEICFPAPALEKATPPPTMRSLTRKSTGSKALTSSSAPPTAAVFTWFGLGLGLGFGFGFGLGLGLGLGLGFGFGFGFG